MQVHFVYKGNLDRYARYFNSIKLHVKLNTYAD